MELTTNYKAIAFCRVSSAQQDYKRQISDLMPLIKADGYAENEIYIIKHKESATKNDINNRKSVAELKDVIAKNPIEAVYCTEASRLARRGDVLYGVLALLEERKIGLVVQTPSIIRTYENGKPNPIAHIVIAFLGQVAQQEMELKRDRQKSGYEQKKKDGKVCASRVIFGYDRTKDGYAVINKNTATNVLDIFKRYAEGQSVGEIWAHYKHLGVFPNLGEKSGMNLISNMLRNTTYIGKNIYFNYPPIIDEELFEKVQKRMDGRKMIKTKLKHIYYAQGLLKYDGHTMTPAVCELTYSYRNPDTHKTTGINMNMIDSLLWDLAQEAKCENDKTDRAVRNENIKKNLKDISEKLHNIEFEITDNDRQQDRTNDLYIKGKIKEDKYNDMIEDLEGQLKHLINEKETLQRQETELTNMLKGNTPNNAINTILDFATIAEITDDELRRQIVKETIKEVIITSDGKGIFNIKPIYHNVALNDRIYYRYEQSGRKKHLYRLFDEDNIKDDITHIIQQRIKRYVRK